MPEVSTPMLNDDSSDILTVSTTHPTPAPSEPAAAAAATDPTPPAAPAAPAAEIPTTDADPIAPSPEDDDAPLPGETPQQTSARKRSKLQTRINELTKARYTAEGERQAARDENERLRRELDALQGRRSSTPTPDGASGDAPAGDKKPASVDEFFAQEYARQQPKPSVDDFESYDAFVEALTDWKADGREFVRAHKHVLSQREQAQTQHYEQVQARTAAFKTAHPDFDSKLTVLNDVPVHRAVMTEIERSEHGAAIIYELASNEAERNRFRSLAPPDQLKLIGRLEARFDATPGAPPASSAAPPRTRVSRAPEPLEPEGGTAVGSKPLDQMTTDERLDAWDEEERAKAKRARR